MECSFWFMRDNHTFIYLGNKAASAFAKAHEAAKQNPYGMVGSVSILDNGKEIRRAGPCCHVDGNGQVDLCEWYKEIMKDEVVKENQV